MTRRRLAALGAGVVVGLSVLAGCAGLGGKATEPFQDAPVSGHNDGAATIVNMPDGFNNVAAKCEGPNRVYATYHKDAPYGAIAVVPNDPRCK